jgi:hypothetical protein
VLQAYQPVLQSSCDGLGLVDGIQFLTGACDMGCYCTFRNAENISRIGCGLPRSSPDQGLTLPGVRIPEPEFGLGLSNCLVRSKAYMAIKCRAGFVLEERSRSTPLMEKQAS